MKKRDLIFMGIACIVIISLVVITLYYLIYNLTDQTSPKNWKSIKFEKTTNIKLPKKYYVTIINENRPILDHLVLIKENNQLRYVGKFFDLEFYLNAKKISFTVDSYNISYINDEDDRKWYDGGNYSNSSGWVETDIIINNKSKRTHLIEIDGTFGQADELKLVLVNVDVSKASKYITDNITRNFFSESGFE